MVFRTSPLKLRASAENFGSSTMMLVKLNIDVLSFNDVVLRISGALQNLNVEAQDINAESQKLIVDVSRLRGLPAEVVELFVVAHNAPTVCCDSMGRGNLKGSSNLWIRSFKECQNKS